jgi:5-methylcytosine-specific restriction enzyme subunit McrC
MRACPLANLTVSLQRRAEGVLLHPSVGKAVDDSATIQDHRIRFMTVDLTGNTSAIRSELLKVFEPHAG